MSLAIVLSLVLVFNFVVTNDVQTSSGTVRGLTLRVLNTSVDQYLNIPYAVPPIGSLRFGKPEPIQTPRRGIIDGTKEGHICWQGSRDLVERRSEDCLVLNIWTANRVANRLTNTTLKPVLFFIHGGGLLEGSIFDKQDKGSGLQFNGSVLATHDIVFVSVNYRLSLFGLLYGGVDSAPGNLALYDQLLALKWVRQNIHLFGGNKDEITIHGWSAGSMSVSAHIMSPQMSKGLFKRAIMESGAHMHYTARQRWSPTEAITFSKSVAKQFNCSDTDWLECLRRVPANRLLDQSLPQSGRLYLIEGTEYLPDSVQTVFGRQLYNSDVDLLAGTTRDETGGDPAKWRTVKEFRDQVQFLDQYFYGLNADNITKFYLSLVNQSEPYAVSIANNRFLSDLSMICPTYLFGRRYAEQSLHNNVFYYEFAHKSKYFSSYNDTDVLHGNDLPFVFGHPLVTTGFDNEEDIEFSRQVMRFWTNFVKYGNPSTDWPHLLGNTTEKNVKVLSPSDRSTILSSPFKVNCDQFWYSYFW